MFRAWRRKRRERRAERRMAETFYDDLTIDLMEEPVIYKLRDGSRRAIIYDDETEVLEELGIDPAAARDALAKKREQRRRSTSEPDAGPAGSDRPDGGAGRKPAVRPAMSEREIRAAGLRIDVPFTSLPPADGPVLRYTDGRTIDDVLREKSPGLFDESE